MFVRGLYAPALALVALIVAGPAYADDDHTVESRTSSYEDTRIPSGFVARLKVDDAFSEGRDLADVIADVPGVWIRRQSSLGQPAFVRVRGGNARQVAVSIDGQRVNVPFGAGFDIGTLSMAGFDQIDVYRGSAGASRGSGALTGALNIQTALRKESGWSTSATSLVGSFGTLGLNADAELASDEVAGRISVMTRRATGDFVFVDPQGTPLVRTNNDHHRIGALTTMRWAPTKLNDLRATASFETGERGSSGPGEFQDAFDDARIDDQRAFSTLRATQRAAVDATWGSIDFDESAGLQWRGQTYTNSATLLGQNAVRNESNYLGVNASAGSVTFVDLGAIVHLGVDARHETYTGQQSGVTDDRVSTDRTTLGTSISTELLFLEDRVSLIGGLRGEWLTRVDDALLPSAGLVVRATDWFHVRSNVARTFRAPDFDELYLDIETVRGNPDLEPERALTWDAGVVIGPKTYRAEVAYFENRIDSLILFLPISSYVLEATNLSGVESRGVEASLSISPFRALSLQGSYTFTDAYLASAETTQLPHQPRHSARTRVELEVGQWVRPVRSLRFNGELQARSRINLDNFGNLTNQGFVTGDLGFTARPLAWMQVGLTVQNVADNQTIVDSLQQPLPGRSFFASLRFDGGNP